MTYLLRAWLYRRVLLLAAVATVTVLALAYAWPWLSALGFSLLDS